MTCDNDNAKKYSFIQVIYRFLGGAALGGLILLIPITYGTFNKIELVQVGGALLLIVLCGLSSIVWGKKFTELVMRILNGTGL